MEDVQQRGEPHDLYYRENGPLGPTGEPAPGPYLLGASCCASTSGCSLSRRTLADLAASRTVT